MGLEATTITIEVNMTRGVMFHLSGLADTAVKESYDRIRAAITNIGFKPPTAELTINLSPADIRKEGSGYDLPLAIGILAAHGKVSDTMLSEYMMIGELGLDGKLKPVSGVLSVAIRARKEQFKGLLVPRENVREAAVVNNLDVYGMDNLSDVISYGGILELRRGIQDASCVGPGKSNLQFELRRKAGHCSRVTAGPIDLI